MEKEEWNVRKWMMPGLLVVCCLFAVLVMYFSLRKGEEAHVPAPAPSDSGQAAPAVDADAAMTIYKSSCLACHGDQLQGAMGPALTQVGASMSQADIHKQIENGGGGMPAFKGQLTSQEIDTLAAWLAAKK